MNQIAILVTEIDYNFFELSQNAKLKAKML